MPRRKIPLDAFSYYVSLGPKGSYEAVARKYGVSKRSVTKLARKESWQAQLEEIQRKARAGATQRALESLEAMNERHLRAVRLLQSKALQALQAVPLETAVAAARALDLAIRQERAIRGEPPESGGVSVEDLIKKEYERWMVADGVKAAQDREDFDAHEEPPGADPTAQ